MEEKEMNNFLIKTDYPVPSCTINRLIWNLEKNSWQYEFSVSIPNGMTLPQRKTIKTPPLYVYGHIQQLKLVSKVPPNSINIVVYSLNDVMELIKKQAQEDHLFRVEWIKKHKDYYDKVTTIKIPNKTQKLFKYTHVISILKQDTNDTTFIVSE
jgi:hypothetical protein